MLILTRKIHQTIKIKLPREEDYEEGQEIVITILNLDTNRVRIGVAAPKEVIIRRGEVWEEINKNK